LRSERDFRREKKNPGLCQGFVAFAAELLCSYNRFYLVERRRALMRVRAEARNAPAEPTTARIAVGFSGERAQPFCACRGRTAKRRRAKPRNIRGDFFIDGLHLRRYWHKSRFVNEEKVNFGHTI
jgi:hypothetical protein